MIWSALFELFKVIIAGLKLLLPSWSPVDFVGMTSTVLGGIPSGVTTWLRWTNYYLPASEAAIAVGVLLTLYVALHSYNAIVYVLVKLHILGGK